MAEGVAQDIINKYTSLSQYWRVRDSRLEEWMDLEALEDDNEDETLESALTNDPATVVGLAVHLLAYYDPVHRMIVDANASDHLLKQAGKAERALKGWWRDVDYTRNLAGQDSWLREISWWETVTGWIVLKAAMERGEDGAPIPIADILSPLDSYPEYGASGLTSFVHRYTTTLSDAASKAALNDILINIPAGAEMAAVEVVDFYNWKRGSCLNAIILEQGGGELPQYIRRPLEWEGRIPVICTPVNGKPQRSGLNRSDRWKTTLGQSILEKNRPIYKEYNKFLSLLAAVARDSANPPWLIKGAGIVVRPEDVQSPADARPTGKLVQTANPNADIKRVDPGKFPVEVQAMVGILDGMVQRGGFPYLLYGGLNTNLSGFAISQLINAAFYQLGPYAKALERTIRAVDKIWLDEFARGGFTSSTVSGQENTGYYIEEFSPSDLPKRFDVDTSIKMAVPDDMMERIQIVRQAIPNLPILDRQTALEDIIHMEDPTLVLDRMDKDAVRVHPIMQQIKLIAELRDQAASLHKDKDHETAALVEQFADYLLGQLTSMGIGAEATGPSARTPGVSPDVMPQEAMGLSPDRMRAAMRMNPSTPNRTRAEQLQQMGVIE